MEGTCMDRFLGNIWGQLLAWQLCSVILCLAGTTCTALATEFGQTIPLLMLSITYFILLITNVWWWPHSDVSWWKYVLIAICGFLGDWTAVLAYDRTSLSSAMLLVTTVIFWVAPLSYFVFHRKINWKQIIAMFIAASGVAMVMINDKGKSMVTGNVLALLSALLYAVSSVTQEKVVTDDSIRLYLCRFSSCAFPMASILSVSVEWKIMANYNWTLKSIGLIFAYGILLAVYYVLVPLILHYSNATIMNLSTLTSNFYSLAISILLFGSSASWFYLIGFFCLPIAITLFVLTETKPENVEEKEDYAPISNEPLT